MNNLAFNVNLCKQFSTESYNNVASMDRVVEGRESITIDGCDRKATGGREAEVHHPVTISTLSL